MRCTWWLGALLVLGCNSVGGGADGDPYAEARAACVSAINAKRATLGLPPYARWTRAERCVDGTLQVDAAHEDAAHYSFKSGQRCDAYAQNTCPGWPSLESITGGCLDMMWDEGPGEDFAQHGHYLNMASDRYTEVACGFFETEGGKVWASQNFR